ncbi:hypothetical protein [Lampropedia aestuarii]|uniref:hypothetical protein n=1 Tax=Lampropedia aestuarii TaxID=2562762 RepID=UPI002468F303|nr:hypothetical protein [Lampropedia aestuarii]MDH5857357.1 hypothetical protein [Lampropedia aestuarii]
MNEISDKEQSEIKEVLKNLYPSTSFSNKTATLETYSIVETIITESQKCTKRKDWIIRAGVPFNQMGYIKKEARRALTRLLLSKENEIYLSCSRVAARNWRTELEMTFK